MKSAISLYVLAGFSSFVTALPSLNGDYTVELLPIFPNGDEGLERRQAPSSVGGNPIEFFGFSFVITVDESQPNELFNPQLSGAVGRVNGTSETISYIHFDLPPADQINGAITEATECIAAIVPSSVLSDLNNLEIPTVLMFDLAPGQQLDKSALSFNTRPSTDQLLTSITYGGDSGADFVSVNQFAKQKCNFGGGMDFAARSIGENSMIMFSANSANDTSAGAVLFVVNP